ncbi:MAG: hypothetical protein Q9183_006531, partial [Haloplaca sp. 2 TL-2023]
MPVHLSSNIDNKFIDSSIKHITTAPSVPSAALLGPSLYLPNDLFLTTPSKPPLLHPHLSPFPTSRLYRHSNISPPFIPITGPAEGKYSKPTRGGGKKFSKNLTPLDADGNPVSMWA